MKTIAAKAVCLIVATFASQAHAACDDLWYARNAILDHHGQCFQSPLARASFTTECGGDLNLDPQTTAKIQEIRQREQDLGCAVDTSRASSDVPGFVDRIQKITTQPIASGTESACIGWRGQTIELTDSPLARGPVSLAGSAHQGDTLTFSHDDIGRSTYVVVYRAGTYWGQGWADLSDVNFLNACDMMAG